MGIVDGYRLCIEIPDLTPLNSAAKLKWRKLGKLKESWNLQMMFAIGGRRNFPKETLVHARVVITRCSSVAPDMDNLFHSAKFILDILQDLKIIKNDDHRCIGMPILRWEKTRPKHGCMRIFVQEVEDHEVDRSNWNFNP